MAWQNEIENAFDITLLHLIRLAALIRLYQFVHNYVSGLQVWNVALCNTNS